MKKKHSLAAWTTLALSLSLLTGCADLSGPQARKLNDYELVRALGLDSGSEKASQIAVTFVGAEAKPSSEKEDSGQNVRTVEANTISAALQKAQEGAQNYLFLGHAEYYLFGETLARDGLTRWFDFLTRTPDTRFSAHVYVVGALTAQTLMTKTKDKDPSATLSAMESDKNLSSLAVTRTISEVAGALSDGTGFLLPILTAQPSKEEGESGAGDTAEDGQQKEAAKKGGGQTGGSEKIGAKENSSSQGDADTAEIAFDGYAIFKGDRMIGKISRADAWGVNLLLGAGDSDIYEVSTPNGEHVAIRLGQVSTKTKAAWDAQGNIAGLTLSVNIQGGVNENQSNLNLMRPKNADQLSALMERQMEETLASAVTQAQNWEVDMLGLGETVRRAHPIRFPEAFVWEALYPTLPIHVNVHVSLRHSYDAARSLQS